MGQYLADVAIAAVCQGHRVRVITANNGYDDPSVRFPTLEYRQGVEVNRLRWSSLGKSSYVKRILSQILFTLQALVKGLIGYRSDVVLVSTIPAFGILAAWLLTRLRSSALVYWVMDINPDEAITVGLVRPSSLLAKLLENLNRIVLESAKNVITLDSLMAQRLQSKARLGTRISVIPPWVLTESIPRAMASGLKFRREHGLDGKFVIMYSGNHSLVHPLDTILDAASRLAHRKEILFLFIGGGVEKRKVERAILYGAPNIWALPYQSFDDLGESLSAADVHVVVMGESMAGIVHPCKIYGAMAAERPVLAIAPSKSHISEIMDAGSFGFRLEHGDVAGVVRAILILADMNEKERTEMGKNAGTMVRANRNPSILRKKFVEILECACESKCNRPSTLDKHDRDY